MVESYQLQYVRSKISAEQYLLHAIQEARFDDSFNGYPQYAEKVRTIIQESFWELDKLDQTSPFWLQTNRIATLVKLPEYAEYKWTNGNDRVASAWLKIACEIFFGGFEQDISVWKCLYDNHDLDCDFMLISAWVMSHTSTDLNINIVSAVSRLFCTKGFEKTFTEIEQYSETGKQWVELVKQAQGKIDYE